MRRRRPDARSSGGRHCTKGGRRGNRRRRLYSLFFFFVCRRMMMMMMMRRRSHSCRCRCCQWVLLDDHLLFLLLLRWLWLLLRWLFRGVVGLSRWTPKLYFVVVPHDARYSRHHNNNGQLPVTTTTTTLSSAMLLQQQRPLLANSACTSINDSLALYRGYVGRTSTVMGQAERSRLVGDRRCQNTCVLCMLATSLAYVTAFV